MENRAIIFVNGLVPDPDAARRLIRPGDMLLAADGGTRHALALGLSPSVIIGDLDSLTEKERLQAESAGARLIRHPREKDATDLDLGLRHAIEAGFREILVLGALGGRLDQTLANLSLLTAPALAGVDARLDDGVEQAFFVRDRGRVRGRAGDLVSLLPWGGEAAGVTTDGLRWPLRGESLRPHETRGVSNEMLGEAASVSIASGLLLVVHRRQSSVPNQQSSITNL